MAEHKEPNHDDSAYEHQDGLRRRKTERAEAYVERLGWHEQDGRVNAHHRSIEQVRRCGHYQDRRGDYEWQSKRDAGGERVRDRPVNSDEQGSRQSARHPHDPAQDTRLKRLLSGRG